VTKFIRILGLSLPNYDFAEPILRQGGPIKSLVWSGWNKQKNKTIRAPFLVLAGMVLLLINNLIIIIIYKITN
jgi:hypothetical protein